MSAGGNTFFFLEIESIDRAKLSLSNHVKLERFFTLNLKRAIPTIGHYGDWIFADFDHFFSRTYRLMYIHKQLLFLKCLLVSKQHLVHSLFRNFFISII